MPRLENSAKKSLLILCFSSLLNWMSFGLVYPIFIVAVFSENPVFSALSSHTLKGLSLGILLASSPIAQFFSSPIIGSISDRLGRKVILQITTLIAVLGYIISAFGIKTGSFPLLIAGRVITGIGAGNISVINSSVADLSLPSLKARNFAWITTSNGVGFALGPFLSGKLATLGLDIPFFFGAALTLLCFCFIYLGFKETFLTKKHTYKIRLREIFHLTALHKSRIFFLSFALFCFGWSFYWEFIPVIWVKNYGLNVSEIGNFYAYGSVCYVISSYLIIQFILKRFSGTLALLSALPVLGIALLCLLNAELKLYWICIAIQQFLVALIFPVGTAIASNLTTKNRQGEVLGVFQSLQSLMFAVTPLFGGAFINVHYNAPLIIGGVTTLLAFAVLLFQKRSLF